MTDNGISRRRLLGGAAAVGVPAAIGLNQLVSGSGAAAAPAAAERPPGHSGHGDFPHASFAKGRSVDHRANGFHPTELLRDFDYGKTRRLPSGRVLREWEIVAADREIEVAPGVKYEAWTYNGRVPGPTLRAREGELLRIRFVNGSDHPHTMHFHGIHSALMDGMPGIGESRGGGQIEPGEAFTYEFDATPFGVHLYHCHVAPAGRPHLPRPLRRLHHRPQGGPPRSRRDGDGDERLRHQLRPRQRGLRGQHDRLPLHQRADRRAARRAGPDLPRQRARVRPGQLLPHPRQLLPTLPDRDLADAEPSSPTRSSRGRRSAAILELEFPLDGDYMFHAHVSEFAELGWSGFFRVGDPSQLAAAAAAALYCDLPWGGGRKA